MTAKDPDKYSMRISRLTIDKLGIKLYDKVAAVLAELIANSYDADATHVTVSVPLDTYLALKSKGEVIDQGYEISIEDNGHGIRPEEVNEHYLKVGTDRRRRPQGDVSKERERPVMGRKGIGKLAPFGICSEIEIISAGGEKTDGEYEVAHLILRYDEIVGDDTEDEYHPAPGKLDGTKTTKRGTTVILRNFQRRRVPSDKSLYRQLTARFGLERDDWHVLVVDATKKTKGFELTGEELAVDELPGTRIDLSDRPVTVDGGDTLPVKGWIAYAKEPYKDEVMAGVRIYARGKIVSQTRDFNIPTGFTGEFKLRSYLTGYIEADWLDSDEDLIRSDRQDIIWNSEKGEALQKWGQQLVKELAGTAETSIKTKSWDEFLEVSNIVNRAKRAFPDSKDFQKSVEQAAKLAVRGADREALRDKDYVERLVSFALAMGPHKALLDILEQASNETQSLDLVIELFGKVRLAETYTLGQVATERIQVVTQLQNLIKSATTERPLQKLIEEAPWLLAPGWTPILQDRSLEQFRKNFEDWYEQEFGEPISTTAIGRAKKEPDFIFIRDSSKLVIVEIKKPGHAMTDDEFERAFGYLDALRKFLDSQSELKERFGPPSLIIVSHTIRLKKPANASALKNDPYVKHRPWRTVLQRTLEAHSDFLSVGGEQASSGGDAE